MAAYLDIQSHFFSLSVSIFSTLSQQDFSQPSLIRDLAHSDTGGTNTLHHLSVGL